MVKLSLVTSIYNGEISPELNGIIQDVKDSKFIELIIVNSGKPIKSDLPENCHSSQIETNLRAERLNFGAKKAQSNKLFFIHPRSYVDQKTYNYLIQNETIKWGGLNHRFNKKSPFYIFTSWYSNHLRAKVKEIFYLDHCLFIRKDLFNKVSGFPKLSIFEDTVISERLRREEHSTLIPFYSTTSAIRFEKNGFLRQALLNQILKMAYNLGANHDVMNKIYEKGLDLNSKY